MLYFPTLTITSVLEYTAATLPEVQGVIDVPVNIRYSALFYAWGGTLTDIDPLLKYTDLLQGMIGGGESFVRVSPPNPEKDGSYSNGSTRLSTPYCTVEGFVRGTEGDFVHFRAVVLSSYYFAALEHINKGVTPGVTLNSAWVLQNYFRNGAYCGPQLIPCSMVLDSPSQKSLDGLTTVRGRLYFAHGNAVSSANDLTYVKELDIKYAPHLTRWPPHLTGCSYLHLGDCPCIPPEDVLEGVKTLDLGRADDTPDDIDDWLQAIRPGKDYLNEMLKYRDLNLALCLIPMTEHPLLSVRSLINARLQGWLP